LFREITSRIKYAKGDDVWLDIACNDGTLLSQVPNEFVKLGIDPADDTRSWLKHPNLEQLYKTILVTMHIKELGMGDKQAKVITTIAMFYDLIDPNPFISDVCEVLDDDGIWVLQLSYTPLMIKQLAFDNICHEHAYYHSLAIVHQTLFKNHGLKIVDCSLNDVNGGSFRVYVQKETS
jgi:NDP-4-keto-2,6-dideoxyhexose 3-C-methyltransferase